ncbi:leucine carboxyl methyltransferase 2 [Colletotrichum tofieldiae]|nr:leucine carboxyl methyltransferase 2 [Colletotrichum tofieldiae]
MSPKPPKTAPSAQKAQKARGTQALDDLIMAERLYYPNEPHYFRFFVKKFQRRAPLINRGYHLRLKVIDTLCEVRYPESCRDVTFVDVDYPDLIEKKRQIVLETPELQGLLGHGRSARTPPSSLRVRNTVR